MVKPLKHDMPLVPLMRSRNISINDDDLFRDLDETIAFLSKVRAQHPGKKIELYMGQYGYEDRYFEFHYSERETNTEYRDRTRDVTQTGVNYIKEQEKLAAKQVLEAEKKVLEKKVETLEQQIRKLE